MPSKTIHLDAPVPARVPWGLSSAIGLVAVVGTILAAVESNDVATIVGGTATVVTMLGRYGQAIVLARRVARAALPWVQAAADLDPPNGGTGPDET